MARIYCTTTLLTATMGLVTMWPANSLADTFGTEANQFDIEFVTIGDPGNAADKTGKPNPGGSVDYVYNIGKYEVSRDMVAKASATGDLGLTMELGSGVTPLPEMPATGVSWNEAARFVNWLNTSEGFAEAYKYATQPGETGYDPNENILLWEPTNAGYDADNLFRNSQAHYFLPSAHEWYKAAFYDPNADGGAGGYWDYPTGSDDLPTTVASGTDPGTVDERVRAPADITLAGGLSPYGVMGQAGNTFEWDETEWDLINDNSSSQRGVRGGNYSSQATRNTLTARGRLSGVPTSEPSFFGFRVASVAELPPENPLAAGDADQDFDFDQLDLVQVQVAAKYLTGQAATWGEGDWNGAPGGSVGSPPAGDGLFNQLDIVAAQQAGTYLTGPYAAIRSGGQEDDNQTSIVYDPSSGEIAVDAPTGAELTSINIDSVAGIFTGDAAVNLGGSFDNDSDNNIFKATFGSSFGSLSFGNVTQAGLSEDFVVNDLTAVGSLAGGGDLGEVDLVYVPEPTSALLLAIGMSLACLGRIGRKS